MKIRHLLTAAASSAPTYVELALKVGTALLITFAATLVLVYFTVYFARSPISPD